MRPAVLLLSFVLLAASLPAMAEERTINRDVSSIDTEWRNHLNQRPPYFEFTPLTSNHDPHHTHDVQWEANGADNQDWDPKKWPKGWTADSAIERFYRAGIFTRQHIRKGGKAGDLLVVDVGAPFYRLSPLDQRRMLKLLADRDGALDQPSKMIEIRDAVTRKVVGTFTTRGLQMY